MSAVIDSHARYIAEQARDAARKAWEAHGQVLRAIEALDTKVSYGFAQLEAKLETKMRDRLASTPEEVEKVVDGRLVAAKLDSYRAKETKRQDKDRDLRVAKWAAYGLVAVGVLEHVIRWIATGHPF